MVLAGKGEPVKEFAISIKPAEYGEWARVAITPQEGQCTFSCDGIRAGSYLLRASAKQFCTYESTVIVNGMETNCGTIVLQKVGRVQCITTGVPPSAVEGASVIIVDHKGIGHRLESNGTGVWQVDDIPPGQYTLRIYGDRVVAYEQALVVQSAELCKVECALREGVRVFLDCRTVMDDNSASVKLTVRSVLPGAELTIRCDRDAVVRRGMRIIATLPLGAHDWVLGNCHGKLTIKQPGQVIVLDPE